MKLPDEYAEEKRVMNWGGIGLIIVGGILLIYGMWNFLSFFTNIPSLISGDIQFTFDTIMSRIFWGMGFAMAGGVMLGIGIYLFQVAKIRKITHYFATETGPATSHMSRAVTRGVHKGGGIPINQNFQGRPIVKIKCRKCGALNDEYAVQCEQCRRKL